MKLLLIDTDGVGLAFALRCIKAAHEVRYFLQDKPSNNQDVGKGFKGLQKISNWVSSVQWADLIHITGNDEYLERLDFFRKKGAKVFGPSAASAKLEIERGQGMKFLEKHGIQVPAYQTFRTLKDAEAHVWKNEKRFVFKTLGDNEDKSLSYCSKSPADMIARLQRWQKLKMNPKGPVMLQEFIPGVEFAVSRWVGSQGFIGQWNENFEHKKFLSGNLGPNTGEVGTIQTYVHESSLGEQMLAPIEKPLVEMGHLGDVDINCIVDEKGKAWALEGTMRSGWPSFNIMINEHRNDPCQWMLDACNGKDTLEVSNEIAAGIVLAMPDYPYSSFTKKETTGVPIYGVSAKNLRYIQPQSVMVSRMPDMDGEKVVEKDIWTTAGDYIAVVTGLGKSVSQACERAYATVKEIHVPDLIYRDDVGEKLKTEITQLQKFNYAQAFSY